MLVKVLKGRNLMYVRLFTNNAVYLFNQQKYWRKMYESLKGVYFCILFLDTIFCHCYTFLVCGLYVD